MDNLKSKSNIQKKTDTGRRSFMWKIGAGMSAVLAAAVPSIAKPIFSSDKKLKTRLGDLSRQVAILENENAIRKLHKAYEEALDKGMYSDILGMFTDEAEVLFNGGLFKGKERGINRLYCIHFRSGHTGRRINPAPGFELKKDEHLEMLEVSSDCRTARARFTYSIQVGTPVDSDSTLVKMARLQGEGIRKWCEGGVYEASYEKANDSTWKIKRLEFKTLTRADYRPGRSYAKPVMIPQFSKVYPHDHEGPDRLVNIA